MTIKAYIIFISSSHSIPGHDLYNFKQKHCLALNFSISIYFLELGKERKIWGQFYLISFDKSRVIPPFKYINLNHSFRYRWVSHNHKGGYGQFALLKKSDYLKEAELIYSDE